MLTVLDHSIGLSRAVQGSVGGLELAGQPVCAEPVDTPRQGHFDVEGLSDVSACLR
jgi:hypothetical protein